MVAPRNRNQTPMKRLAPLLLAALAATTLTAGAQATRPATGTQPATQNDKTSDTEEKNRFWQVSLPGGSYMVALDRISSVSLHQYVLDSSVLVTEVTVDTVGQALTRFYYLAPVTDGVSGSGVAKGITGVVERGRELVERGAGRVGTNLHEMVVKQYPTTTHAHTIEYRLLDEGNLRALYESVRKAWESGRGRKFAMK